MFFAAIILLFALLAIKLSNKSGLPSLLLFLGLGIFCSRLGFSFDNFPLSERFSTLALMIIIFYGGFGTNWKMGKPVFKEAVTLASLGVVLTALLTALSATDTYNLIFWKVCCLDRLSARRIMPPYQTSSLQKS